MIGVASGSSIAAVRVELVGIEGTSTGPAEQAEAGPAAPADEAADEGSGTRGDADVDQITVTTVEAGSLLSGVTVDGVTRCSSAGGARRGGAAVLPLARLCLGVDGQGHGKHEERKHDDQEF